MNNTPAAQPDDAWLQEQFDYVLRKATGKTYPGQRQKRVEEAKATIRAHEAAAVAKARIAEWTRFSKWGEAKAKKAEDIIIYIERRVAELQRHAQEGGADANT